MNEKPIEKLSADRREQERNALRVERDALRAREVRVQALVEAARDIIAKRVPSPGGAWYEEFNVLAAALDAMEEKP